MRSSVSLGAVVLAAALVAGCDGFGNGSGDGAPKYRYAPITRADVVRTVEATGTITPRNTSKGIPVGAQVNGKVIKMFVDYNSTCSSYSPLSFR